MKKLLAILIIFSLLLCAIPSLAEDAVGAAAEALKQCASLDDQLAVLDTLATDGTAALDAPGWTDSLSVPLTEELPVDLRPGTDAPEHVDALPEALIGARFIAVFEDCTALYGEDGLGELSLLGDFQARLPEPNRARNLAEAEAFATTAATSAARPTTTSRPSRRSRGAERPLSCTANPTIRRPWA